MATQAISWAPGAHVHFGDLDFIITLGGELAHAAAQSLPSINLSRLRLEGPRGDSLGPQLSREPPRSITLFLEGPVRSASTTLPFGLRNATATAGHLLSLRMVKPPTDSKFVGVVEHDPETLYGLLAEELESSSSSDSSKGSHHPSRECFMTQTPEGDVQASPERRQPQQTTPTPGSRRRW